MFNPRDVIEWLHTFGAPMPTLEITHVNNPGGDWDWLEAVFTNGTATYRASLPYMAAEPNGPGTALAELRNAGLAPTAPTYRVEFAVATPPPPPPPQPVDNFVGIPDPAHAGLFQPASNVSPMWLYAQFLSGQPYFSPTGRKFKVVSIGGGLMSTFDFAEAV